MVRSTHCALVAARAELDAALRCFGEAERAEAANLVGRPGPVSSIDETRGGVLDGYGRGPRAEAERERLVSQAIEALPSARGTRLTRGDLVRSRDPQLTRDSLIRLTEESMPEGELGAYAAARDRPTAGRK